ncbi:MAG: HAD family phosphatase [Ignavibacteriaceae bacterium]
MIKAIFWDNDGILVDTERLYFAATKNILATVNLDLTREMYIDYFLVQGNGTWHLAKKKGLSSEEINNLRNKRNVLYGQMLERECKIIDGAKEVVEALFGKYLMGIVTSSRKDHFDLIHKPLGILKYFDFVLTGDNYKKFKPDPEPYLLAVEKSGFHKNECIAIEDSERGLISAKAAGIHCFVIPSELTSNGNFSAADKVLKNISELPVELSELNI